MFSNLGVLPYTNYWVGFFHHTFEVEFAPANSCFNVFSKPVFIESLVLCKGIYCLTEYLAEQLRENLSRVGYPDIKVNSLHHPTIFVDEKFTMEKFMGNKSRGLINVGSWYRNPITIYRIGNLLSSDLVTFKILRGKLMDGNFPPDSIMMKSVDGKIISDFNKWTTYFARYIDESPDSFSSNLKGVINDCLLQENTIDIRSHGDVDLIKDFLDKISVINTLSNDELDLMYGCNIIFLDLVDSSAVNTILECIVRETPVLINKIPPTIELLGENYPLMYDSLEDIESLLTIDKIGEATEFMKNMDKNIYKIDTFIDSMLSSQIYKSL
jgi:hypothetical protein